MSRSFGGTRLTTIPPIAISPSDDFLESGDHSQERGLAAPGRADEHAEFAIGDRDVDTANHVRGPEMLVDGPDADACHRLPSLVPSLRPARAGRDDVVGPPGREPGDDILRRLAPQLALGLN